MPKFTLIGEHTDIYGKPDGTKVTYEFYVEGLNDVLEHVDLFIRGCGYMPPPGVLDYVVDEYSDHDGDSIIEDYPELHSAPGAVGSSAPLFGDDGVQHSHYYYDKDRNK